MRASIVRFGLLTLLALRAVAGHAQEPAGYTAETEQGIAEFGDGRFEESRAHFLKAHALYPNARTLRALGLAEFELRNYVDSVRYLEQALASSVKPLDGPRRNEAVAVLAKANDYVGRYTLRVAADVRVQLDGSELDPASSALLLSIGNHVLEFRAPGRILQRQTVAVRGGERETLRVELLPLHEPPKATQETPKATSNEPRRDGKRPLYKNPWLWSAVALVVGGATAGVLVTVRNDAQKAQEPNPGTGGARPLMPPR